jgi:hypothetical protein
VQAGHVLAGGCGTRDEGSGVGVSQALTGNNPNIQELLCYAIHRNWEYTEIHELLGNLDTRQFNISISKLCSGTRWSHKSQTFS